MNKSKLLHKVALAGGVAGIVGASLLGIPQEAKAGTAEADARAFFSGIRFNSNFGLDLADFSYSVSCNANGNANQLINQPFGAIGVNCNEGIPNVNGAESSANAGLGAANGPTGPIANNSSSHAFTTAPPPGFDNSTSEFSTITATFTVPAAGSCGAGSGFGSPFTPGTCTAKFEALLEPFLDVTIDPENPGAIKFAEAKFDANFQISQVVGGTLTPVFGISRGDNISVSSPPVGILTQTKGAIPNGTLTPGTLDEFFSGGFDFTSGSTYQITFNANTVARTVASQAVPTPEPSAILGLLAVGGLGLGLKRKKQS